MKRIFSNAVFPLAVGLSLRLLFVLKFPASSGDTILYEQIAANWLKHHVYGMNVNGAIMPVDLRMPGYPAFLAVVYALTGRTGESVRLWVMLAQIAVDLLGCLVIARLARLLACSSQLDDSRGERVQSVALWLAALCPFTANYTAVPLTEVFASLWTGLACCVFTVALLRVKRPEFLVRGSHMPLRRSAEYTALAAGVITGLGTLFRPEAPLLLAAAAVVFGVLFFSARAMLRWLWVSLAMVLGCLLVLSPWALRNIATLSEPQFLAPKYSNLPGELIPYGFMAWEKTWLFRVSDCYLVPWKLNEEAIDVDEIPARAFDSPEEKQRVAAILEPYNEDLTLTKEEDDAFAQIARERRERHPLRTHLWIPAARAVTLWFSPRIELLPISGHVFPLAYMREEDPVDQESTILLFLLNVFYVGLGAWGAVRLWRSNASVRPMVGFLILFMLSRTAFLITLETPEPRYTLVCFPALIAMGAQLFAGKRSDRERPEKLPIYR
jgi:4-amino-4-deoxy-L-arabinose transferase-like glycosyltransferase